jgi:putative transposase
VKRTNVVELVVGKEEHEKLKELGVTTARCWNEVNWLRMQQFKKGEWVDLPRQRRRYMRNTNTC